jgi:hypothetical protein
LLPLTRQLSSLSFIPYMSNGHSIQKKFTGQLKGEAIKC